MSVIEALQKVKVRYPGAPEAVLLGDLIADKRLVEFLEHQYPTLQQLGHVQFIPEIRGYRKENPGVYFLDKELQQVNIQEKHGSDMAGVQHEIKVQDLFESLRNSDLLKDRSLVVMFDVKKETIRHSKLQKAWTNEFDLIIFDTRYGVFVCEIKQREYATLKKSSNPKYSLERELGKQENRYKLLSQLREFYGNNIPIHTVMICNSRQDDQSCVVEEEIKQRNEGEYKFVINLNLKDKFSSVWNKVLDRLDSVTVKEDIMGFTSLMYAIQSVEELKPSEIHHRFINTRFQEHEGEQKKGKGKGKKSKTPKRNQNTGPDEGTIDSVAILWTSQQQEILDYVGSCIKSLAADGQKMRICISGGMGSGKTMLLEKFAKMFSHRFPGIKILFLVAVATNSLLLKRLSSCPELNTCNITLAPLDDYMTRSRSTNTEEFRPTCTPYDLILVDEYYWTTGCTLDVSAVDTCHIALVTSKADTAVNVTDFKIFKLSGSLRATKNITEYVMKKQELFSLDVPVTPAHNVSYRPVIEKTVSSGEQCIKEVTACVKHILHNDSNASILIISVTHRWLLYTLSQQLLSDNITHQFKMHSTRGSSATSADQDNNSTIILCDPHEALGYESSTVVFVAESGMHAEIIAAYFAAVSVSRGTTEAFVYTIDGVYSTDISIIPPTVTTHTTDITVPCLEHVAQKNINTFKQYLTGLVPVMSRLLNSDRVRQNQQHAGVIANSKILVLYKLELTSIMRNIENSLPRELRECLVFVCNDNEEFYNLDLSKDVMLLLDCHTTASCNKMYTTLPVKAIQLVAAN